MRTAEELVTIVNSMVSLTQCKLDERFGEGKGTALRQVFNAFIDQAIENLDVFIRSQLNEINRMRKKINFPLLEISSSTCSTQSKLSDLFRSLEGFIKDLPLPLEKMTFALKRLTSDFPLPPILTPYSYLSTSLQVYCCELMKNGHLDCAIIASEELSVDIHQDRHRIELMDKLLEKKRTAEAIRIFSKLLDTYYNGTGSSLARNSWLYSIALVIVKQLVNEEGFESALAFARNSFPPVYPFTMFRLRIEDAHIIEKVWEYIQSCGVISKRVRKAERAINFHVNSSKETFQKSQRRMPKKPPDRRTSLVFFKSPRKTLIEIKMIVNERSSSFFSYHRADSCMVDIKDILENGISKGKDTLNDYWGNSIPVFPPHLGWIRPQK